MSNRDSYFGEYGFTKGGKPHLAAQLVLDVVPDLAPLSDLSSSEFVTHAWGMATAKPESTKDLRGGIFEAVLTAAFIRADLSPFYVQAQVQHVPNVNFDFVFWTEEHGPVAVSAKTSLRERYKQADLEAMALSNVHRRSRSFLVTLDADEAARVKAKISTGDVIALTDVVIANSISFDRLIEEILKCNRFEAPNLPAVARGRMIQHLEPSHNKETEEL